MLYTWKQSKIWLVVKTCTLKGNLSAEIYKNILVKGTAVCVTGHNTHAITKDFNKCMIRYQSNKNVLIKDTGL